MKVRTFALLLALLLLVALGTASAGSVTYSSTLPPVFSSTDLTNAPISLPEWNPSSFPGEILTSVDFDIDGYLEGTIILTNNAAGAVTVDATTSSDMTVYTIDSDTETLGSLILSFTTGSQLLAKGASETFPASGEYGDSGPVYTSGLLTSGLGQYEGNGDFSVYVSTVSGLGLLGGGGNVQASQVTEAGTSWSVTYDYAASPVPEPVSLALLGSGLVVLGLLKRKRFVR